MSDQPPEKSLRDELKRRKTQQLQQAQADAQKRATQASPSAVPNKPPPPAAQPSKPATPPARTTTTTTRAQPTRTSAQPSGRSPLSDRRVLIGAFIGVLFLVVLLGTVLISSNVTTTTPTSTQVKLPTTTARDVLDYLTRAGVQITNISEIEVPNDTWKATQGFQFDAEIDGVKGTFIVLSYADGGAAGADAFTMELDEKYGPWKTYSISNIIVLSTPETPQTIDVAIASHITSYIAGAVVAFLPTSTGTFIGAAATDAVGTQVAQLGTQNAIATNGTPIVLTVDATIITLTPRPPTATATVTETPTPRPSRTPTLPFTEIPTHEPSSVPETRTPIATTEVNVGAATEVPTDAALAISPTPDKSRAERFVAAAPRFLEPLRMDTSSITTDHYGATFNYLTNDGLQYQVVLWLTGDPAAAKERFNLDLSLVTGSQALTIGDQAYIAPPENTTLGEMLYKDMVLIIYYPRYSSTVPPSPISQDDLLRLLQRLYTILPVE